MACESFRKCREANLEPGRIELRKEEVLFVIKCLTDFAEDAVAISLPDRDGELAIKTIVRFKVML